MKSLSHQALAKREAPPLRLRSPSPGDAWQIHALARNCPPLEVNSCYAYLVLCTHFADGCVVAEHLGKPAGYIAGYRIPGREDTQFIWQIGVAPDARGRGLGRRMLSEIAKREAPVAVRFIEATVSPDNGASMGLFRDFAARNGYDFHEEPQYFSERMFGDTGHGEEHLIRIGPMR